MTITDAPRQGARLGAWSLILAAFPLVYIGVGLLLGLLGQGKGGNDIAGVTAYVLFFLAFLVIPACLLVALVLGIIALLKNRTLGKVLAVLALVIVFAMLGLLIFFLTGSDSPLFWTDF
jgi:hypothetical protein